ncbi:MAG: uroporphyrinogen decarboxylase family protein, partial [Candidatus Latescibacteria bacterium]|nr:uroporphyrinogen decarboxylase family protein [Candidatus Latescibacterota bacterium]
MTASPPPETTAGPMSNRQRLLTIMDGGQPDRIPWIPRLLIWHTAHKRQGSLPSRFEGLSLRQVERELGMGTPARDGRIFAIDKRGDVEIETRSEGESELTTYRTPAGAVSTRYRSSEELARVGIQSLEVEHMIKGPDDFAAVEYMVQHAHYDPTPQDYLDYEAEIGADGYPLVAAGDCPFHHFLQKLAGYQQGYYILNDYPSQVEGLLETMEALDRERLWPVVAESPARLILHGIHFDSLMTPPQLFERYIAPYYRDFTALLHQSDKKLCMHADNDSRLILEHIEDAGFDMVETFTTAPQVSCTLEEARRAWGTRMIIWGAVPSVILEPVY